MAKPKVESINLDKGGTRKTPITLDYKTLRKAVLTLRALNHPLRKEIIGLLEKKDSMTVTEIYVKLRLEQSVASQHLAILRRSGILDTKREGKFINYSLNKKRLEQISVLIDDLA